jgi:hypothetical protein
MEPDDLLCSRNARLKKALVGRAQWKINQPPSLKRERASLQGSPVASFDTRGEGRELEQETIPARHCRGLSAELLGYDLKEFDLEH